MSVVSASNGLRFLKLGAVAVFAAGASGCATTVLAVGASAAAVAISDKTAGDAIDDAAASAEIKAQMFSGKGFNLADVHVAVSEGFVLLAGTTPTPQDRIEAERRAWSVSAVRNVANELQVGSSRTMTQSLKDKVIGTQVRSKFLSSDVKGMNFAIETHNGQVYLLGIARTSDELGDAVNQARTVNGVQKVVSYVRVDKRPVIERPETPAEAAARRAEEQGLRSPTQPQQTLGTQTASGARPDYAPQDYSSYEPAQRADYGQSQYSQQPSYAQPSAPRQTYAAQSQPPSQGAPYDYGSPSSGGAYQSADLGPASEEAVVSRPSVPDVAPSTPEPQAPVGYNNPPAARPVPGSGSGPVMLTPP